jgi:hypothetical protein
MISPNNEQPRLSKHSRQEVVMCRELRPKLLRRVDRRIHVPADPFLGHGERTDNVLKWRVANYEKVDVARRPELTPRRGPEHERDLNAVAKRCESVSQDVDESSRLRE